MDGNGLANFRLSYDKKFFTSQILIPMYLDSILLSLGGFTVHFALSEGSSLPWNKVSGSIVLLSLFVAFFWGWLPLRKYRREVEPFMCVEFEERNDDEQNFYRLVGDVEDAWMYLMVTSLFLGIQMGGLCLSLLECRSLGRNFVSMSLCTAFSPVISSIGLYMYFIRSWKDDTKKNTLGIGICCVCLLWLILPAAMEGSITAVQVLNGLLIPFTATLPYYCTQQAERAHFWACTFRIKAILEKKNE